MGVAATSLRSRFADPSFARREDAGIVVDAGVVATCRAIPRAEFQRRRCTFRYQLSSPRGTTTYEISAAAVSALDAAGEYTSDLHRRAVSFLRGPGLALSR